MDLRVARREEERGEVMMAPETLVAMIVLAAVAFVLGFLGGVAFATGANGQSDDGKEEESDGGH